MLLQAGGGSLLQSQLLTQLLQEPLLPGEPHLSQGSGGGASEGQSTQSGAEKQLVALQDASCGPVREGEVGQSSRMS